MCCNRMVDNLAWRCARPVMSPGISQGSSKQNSAMHHQTVLQTLWESNQMISPKRLLTVIPLRCLAALHGRPLGG